MLTEKTQKFEDLGVCIFFAHSRARVAMSCEALRVKVSGVAQTSLEVNTSRAALKYLAISPNIAWATDTNQPP